MVVFELWLGSNTKGVGKTTVFPLEENTKNRGFLEASLRAREIPTGPLFEKPLYYKAVFSLQIRI